MPLISIHNNVGCHCQWSSSPFFTYTIKTMTTGPCMQYLSTNCNANHWYGHMNRRMTSSKWQACLLIMLVRGKGVVGEHWLAIDRLLLRSNWLWCNWWDLATLKWVPVCNGGLGIIVTKRIHGGIRALFRWHCFVFVRGILYLWRTKERTKSELNYYKECWPPITNNAMNKKWYAQNLLRVCKKYRAHTLPR